tara:strand:- start:315 stop:443 length:129 start_codon:yes stop_codon:yes gene_type:complete
VGVCAYRADPAVSPAVSGQFHQQFQKKNFVKKIKSNFVKIIL